MKFILLTLVEEMVPPSLVCPVQPTKLLLKRLRPENRSNLELYLSRVLTPTFWGGLNYPRSFSFSSSMPTSVHTLNSTGNWSIVCSFSILELTTVWVGLMYSWPMIPIWVAKAKKQQRCVKTQGLKTACISAKRFGWCWSSCIEPTFTADILTAARSRTNWEIVLHSSRVLACFTNTYYHICMGKHITLITHDNYTFLWCHQNRKYSGPQNHFIYRTLYN